MKRGFTLVEILISIVVMTIAFFAVLAVQGSAIGAYNASKPALRRAYAERVYRQVAATRARPQPGQPTVASTRPLPVTVMASTQ